MSSVRAVYELSIRRLRCVRSARPGPAAFGSRCRSLSARLPALALLLAISCAHAQPTHPWVGLSPTFSELQLHLREDPYRSFAHVGSDGGNFFAVTRWQIERLQRERGMPVADWKLEDFLLEFARARTLERLNQYREAGDAYRRVATGPAELTDAAADGARVMDAFAGHVTGLTWGLTGPELAADLASRAADWYALSEAQTDAGYASLALVEAERWQVLRVEMLAESEGPAAAIAVCEELLQRHRESKLYPRHLVLLGNLHAEAARAVVSRIRAEHASLEESAYERHLEAALSAYEKAMESRVTPLRDEARDRMNAVMAYHDGVLNGVH